MSKFLILFLIITFSEVYLMKLAAEKTSFLFLLMAVITTGIIGFSLAKKQGKDHLAKIQQELLANKIPGNPLVEGLLILVAAVVLMTPGFITDIIGFLLLIPALRKRLAPEFASWLKPSGPTAATFFRFSSHHRPSSTAQNQKPVEVDFFDMPSEESTKDKNNETKDFH